MIGRLPMSFVCFCSNLILSEITQKTYLKLSCCKPYLSISICDSPSLKTFSFDDKKFQGEFLCSVLFFLSQNPIWCAPCLWLPPLASNSIFGRYPNSAAYISLLSLFEPPSWGLHLKMGTEHGACSVLVEWVPIFCTKSPQNSISLHKISGNIFHDLSSGSPSPKGSSGAWCGGGFVCTLYLSNPTLCPFPSEQYDEANMCKYSQQAVSISALLFSSLNNRIRKPGCHSHICMLSIRAAENMYMIWNWVWLPPCPVIRWMQPHIPPSLLSKAQKVITKTDMV